MSSKRRVERVISLNSSPNIDRIDQFFAQNSRLLDEGGGDLTERVVMLKKKIKDEVKDISLEIL
jgi:hypothetical protein